MKISEILARVNSDRPNGIDENRKIEWIRNLEKEIYDRFLSKFEDTEEYQTVDAVDDELLVDDTYAEMYMYYLFGKIDLVHCEYERYNNDAALYNQIYTNWCAWYREQHEHKITKFIV